MALTAAVMRRFTGLTLSRVRAEFVRRCTGTPRLNQPRKLSVEAFRDLLAALHVRLGRREAHWLEERVAAPADAGRVEMPRLLDFLRGEGGLEEGEGYSPTRASRNAVRARRASVRAPLPPPRAGLVAISSPPHANGAMTAGSTSPPSRRVKHRKASLVGAKPGCPAREGAQSTGPRPRSASPPAHRPGSSSGRNRNSARGDGQGRDAEAGDSYFRRARSNSALAVHSTSGSQPGMLAVDFSLLQGLLTGDGAGDDGAGDGTVQSLVGGTGPSAGEDGSRVSTGSAERRPFPSSGGGSERAPSGGRARVEPRTRREGGGQGDSGTRRRPPPPPLPPGLEPSSRAAAPRSPPAEALYASLPQRDARRAAASAARPVPQDRPPGSGAGSEVAGEAGAAGGARGSSYFRRNRSGSAVAVRAVGGLRFDPLLLNSLLQDAGSSGGSPSQE